MWGLTIRSSTRYRFAAFYRRLPAVSRQTNANDCKRPTSLPGIPPAEPALSPKKPPVGRARVKNTTQCWSRPDGTFVAGAYPPTANRPCISPVEKWCRTSRLSSPLVLLECRSQRGRQIDAEVIGQQDDDEQHITELIGDRPVSILRCARLVAPAKIQLASELAHLLGQAGVLRQRRPVASALFDPRVDKCLDR